jgi:hypothetical protein
MFHKDYDHKGSIDKKNIFGRESQGAWRQDELIGGKEPVVNSDRLKSEREWSQSSAVK